MVENSKNWLFAEKEFIYLQLIAYIFVRDIVKKGKFMLKKYIKIILIVSLVAFSGDIFAHGGPGGPPCGSPPCGPPPPPDTPIDGGIGYLLILGIGYAIKKIKFKN